MPFKVDNNTRSFVLGLIHEYVQNCTIADLETFIKKVKTEISTKIIDASNGIDQRKVEMDDVKTKYVNFNTYLQSL